eukprot:TRINITY_DN36856_c0_g1_i1.p1 TRINITY_DN36856_c0_g1~~TRINITY_DN36856_c0_g1_i1.p1  ORF type:complete len:485 (+),score=19.09 TRINITY_DN36856_c0_g1_i1:42-1496(+)
MSITVFLRTPHGVHDVDVKGSETVGCLYTKASHAADLAEGRFKLIWNGGVLDRGMHEQIQGSGMAEGSEVLVEADTSVRQGELTARRSELEDSVKADPEMVLVVDVSGGGEVCNLHNSELPAGIRHLVLIDPEKRVTTLGSNFLSGHPSLVSVDLRDLCNVVTICNSFLYGCRALVSVELSGLNIESIGSDVLYCCTSLKSVDLSTCTRVKSIGNSFLFSARSLTCVDMSSLCSVETIGSGFLVSCSSLTFLDLSCMRSLRSIHGGFLSHCTSLSAVDLSGFDNLNSVGSGFLVHTSLESADLSSLRNVVSAGDYFLAGCASLTSVNLSGLNKMRTIGSHFLAGDTSLVEVDLGGMESITTVGDDFLSDTALAAVDLTPLSNIHLSKPRCLSKGLMIENMLPNGFLKGCRSLAVLDFHPLGIERLDPDTDLVGCISLATIRLAGTASFQTREQAAATPQAVCVKNEGKKRKRGESMFIGFAGAA